MTRRRILCKIFMLVLIAAGVCMMSVGMGAAAAITTEYNGDFVSLTGFQSNPIIWNSSNFEGFNYGLNSHSSETLTITPFTLYGPNIDRTIDAGNLVYNSTAQIKQFEWDQFGSYKIMGFMAEPYFTAYLTTTNFSDSTKWGSIENINLLSGGNLSKVLIDSDDKYTIITGDGLNLKEGYVLNVQQVDLGGNKVLFELTKDGKVVDTEVVYQGQSNAGDDLYVYDELTLGDEADTSTIVARVDTIFRGAYTNAVTIQGIFQISDNITSVEAGDIYGAMEITSVDSTSILMENYVNIILERKSVQPIMGNITFQVADNDTISFYPSVGLTNDSVDDNPVYADYCCLWNLSEGYAFAFSQVDINGQKALFFLLKDGRVVDAILLTEEFSTDVYSNHDYQYVINGTEIINATLKSVFNGIVSSAAKLAEVNQRSEIDGSLLLINDSHIFKSEDPAGIVWNLSDGYALTTKDVSLDGKETWLELSKNGVVVNNEILNEDFANTSIYTSGIGNISYSLEVVFSGANEHAVMIKNVYQYSDVNGSLLLNNGTHLYKTGNPAGMSWALPDGYALTMKDVGIEGEKVWFGLSKDGIIFTENILKSGDSLTHTNGSESFNCTVDGVMHGTLADVVKINGVNLYSDTGVQLVFNDSRTYASGNPQGEIWVLAEGYSLNPKDVDLNGNQVWLSLEKDGNVVTDEIIYAPEWFNYYNSTGALVFSTYVDTVFRGTDTNGVILESTKQYSEVNGSLIFQNLYITLEPGISLVFTIPSISINSPSDGATVSTPTITVSGTASDDIAVAIANVTVNLSLIHI